jgi:hypothetical protein
MQTLFYVYVTYGDTQERSPSAPCRTEWEVCWPMATWYMSWHTAICLSVVSLPSRLFKLECDFLPPPVVQASNCADRQFGRSEHSSRPRLEAIGHLVSLVSCGCTCCLCDAWTVQRWGSWDMGTCNESVHRRDSGFWARGLHIRWCISLLTAREADNLFLAGAGPLSVPNSPLSSTCIAVPS